jgi:hypothetical protein
VNHANLCNKKTTERSLLVCFNPSCRPARNGVDWERLELLEREASPSTPPSGTNRMVVPIATTAAPRLGR